MNTRDFDWELLFKIGLIMFLVWIAVSIVVWLMFGIIKTKQIESIVLDALKRHWHVFLSVKEISMITQLDEMVISETLIDLFEEGRVLQENGKYKYAPTQIYYDD